MGLVEYTMKGTNMRLRDALTLNGNCFAESEAEDMLSLIWSWTARS